MIRLLTIVAVTFLLVQVVHAHPPTGIVVDKSGLVYFTDLETIWKLDTAGRLSIFRAGVSGRHVHELAIDKDGNLFGADLTYESEKWISAVWKMNPQGQLTYVVEPSTNPPRGASLFHDRAGNMYLAEVDNQTKQQSVLLKRAPDGQLTVLAGGGYGYKDGKGSEAQFGSIGGIFIDSDASIYLTDGTRLRKVSSDGVVTTIASNLNQRTVEDVPMLFEKNDGILAGLTVDSSKNVYVADAGNQRLLKIDPHGAVQVVYRGEEHYYPNGVTIDPSGTIYVLEVGYKPPSTWLPARIRKIVANGDSSLFEFPGKGIGPPIRQTDRWNTRYSNVSLYKFGLAVGAVALIAVGCWGLIRSWWRS